MSSRLRFMLVILGVAFIAQASMKTYVRLLQEEEAAQGAPADAAGATGGTPGRGAHQCRRAEGDAGSRRERGLTRAAPAHQHTEGAHLCS